MEGEKGIYSNWLSIVVRRYRDARIASLARNFFGFSSMRGKTFLEVALNFFLFIYFYFYDLDFRVTVSPDYI